MKVEDVNPLDQGIRGRIEGLRGGVDGALLIPAYRLGIEIRPIVALDSPAQIKHINLAVFQDVPGDCQVGDIVKIGVNDLTPMPPVGSLQPWAAGSRRRGEAAGACQAVR